MSLEGLHKDMPSGKPLLDVLNGIEPSRRPIWLMRQAGRYLPEYRKVREQAGSFLSLCYTPELACEVTLQPLRRFDLDAAILFADILLIPQALGAGLEFKVNEGPVLTPVRCSDDVAGLKCNGAMDHLAPVFETVSLIKRSLDGHIALIGFCGAPWTVATYMVEGGTSPDRANTRIAAHQGVAWLDRLIDMLVESSVEYLCHQVEAGAEAVQIFDTWAGDLPDGLREKYCFEPIRRIVDGVRNRVPELPVIGFARGIGREQMTFARVSDVNAVGVEWSASVEWLATDLSKICPVQGNIDPAALIAGGKALESSILSLTRQLEPSRHIMNLGHGIRPDTPIEHVSELVSLTRQADG